MRIVVVTVSPELMYAFAGASARLEKQLPQWGEVRLFSAVQMLTPDDRDALRSALTGADVVIFDLMSAHSSWQAELGALLPRFGGWIIPSGPILASFGRLGRFDMRASMRQANNAMPTSMPPKAMPAKAHQDSASDLDPAATDARAYSEIIRAVTTAQDADGDFVLAKLLSLSGVEIEVPKPSAQTPTIQLLDAKSKIRHDNLTDFEAAVGGPVDQPVIALLYNGGNFPHNVEPIAVGIANQLSEIGWVLPIACNAGDQRLVDALRTLFAERKPNIVLSLRPFRLSAGPTGGEPEPGEEFLRELGVPYLHPVYTGIQRYSEWLASDQGMSPGQIISALQLPEMDGARDEILVAATEPIVLHDLPGAPKTEQFVLIDEQIDRLKQRTAGWLNLQAKPAANKRVAIIGYDYPNGEGNLLGGAFLDVAASIEVILADLASQGYQVTLPQPGTLLDRLRATAVNDPQYGQPRSIQYPRHQAEADIANPQAWQTVNDFWADVTTPMTTPEGDFFIPAIEFGNVLVGIQPGRSPRSPGKDAAHDNTVPPHPQYLAFYAWLRKQWQADVIVHVGTHGTFEFLKSKQAVVSVHDFPDLMLEGTPHVYLYYVGNPSEGVTARRRSHAVLVSYQPPLMTEGGLHGELAELHHLLHDLQEARSLQLGTVEQLTEDIAELAEQAHLPTDPDVLASELERLETGLVPIGLHVFGQSWSPAERVQMVLGLLAGGLDDQPIGLQALASSKGLGNLDDLSHDQRAELNAELAELVAAALNSPDTALAEFSSDDQLAEVLSRAREISVRWSDNHELASLRDALNAKHLPSRLGGDALRTPEVLPSGGNIHIFDPNALPTPIAVRRGAQAALSVRQAHQQVNAGAEPRCIGVVLWGIETSRTQGETYAQILALLGVRITGRAQVGRRRWEIIPTAELDGPRVDVVVTLSGFFRDLFGNLIEELDDIIKAVAALPEPAEINPIAARSRALAERLIAEGMSQDQAQEFATIRLFGPAPGKYGTNVTELIDSSNWQSNDDLADRFITDGQFAYARGHFGEAISGLYAHNLRDIETVSQIRSSNEYQVTDLDHYFEFLGGVTSAARQQSGRQITTLVCDTTGRNVHTSDVAEATRAGLYTRLLNPKWTEAMLNHGHRGVSEINNRTTNLLGLSALTAGVDDWMFDAVYDRYIADEQMRARLAQANPHATAAIAARLSEADQRGLWNATDEQRDLLADVQFDIDAELEGVDF